jgi:hypothetical protein
MPPEVLPSCPEVPLRWGASVAPKQHYGIISGLRLEIGHNRFEPRMYCFLAKWKPRHSPCCLALAFLQPPVERSGVPQAPPP